MFYVSSHISENKKIMKLITKYIFNKINLDRVPTTRNEPFNLSRHPCERKVINSRLSDKLILFEPSNVQLIFRP